MLRATWLLGLCTLLAVLWAAPALPADPPAEEEALVPVQVKRLVLVQSNPAVVLVDEAEERYLLIFIDFFMANAIQMGLREPTLERPLTHDLMGILLRRLGGELTRVSITALKDNTYYALLSLQVNGDAEQIDVRPSDALALAVRTGAPIFAAPALLSPLENGQIRIPGPEPAEEPQEPEARGSA